MEEIELIKSWKEVDVEMFMDLKVIDLNEFSTRYSFQLEQLCILTGTVFDDDIWDDMSVDDIEDYFDKIAWVNKEPKGTIKQTLGKYKYKGMDRLTLGEYIDLDIYCSKGYFRNLDLICAVLFRKYKVDEFENVIFEDYNFNIDNRKEDFHSINILDVYGIIQEFLKFKEEIEKSYEILFQNTPDGDDESDTDLTPEEKSLLKKELELEKKKASWIWEDTVYKLAGGDITKMEDIFNLNVKFVFNMLGYKVTFKE